jgi:hypothetical protein
MSRVQLALNVDDIDAAVATRPRPPARAARTEPLFLRNW